MNLKKWTLLVAMMGVLLATAFANNGNEFNKNRADFLKERKAYFNEHIKPKVDEQRKKLEVSLTVEDKKEIARLREEIIKQRLLQNEFMFEARASHIKGGEVDEDLHLELQAQRIVIENLRDEAKIIANKYRPEIDDLVADLKVKFRENGRGLRYQNKGFNNRMGFHGNRGNHGKRGPNGPGNSGMMGNGFGYRSPGGFGHRSPGGFDIASFLLWDVNRG